MKMAAIASIVLATVSLAPIAFGQTSSSLSSAQFAERTVHRRAVEAVIWGMPAVNYDLMLQEALKAGAKENQIIYWGKPSDWHNQTLTPNPDSIYLMTFFTTKDVGPVVIEVPPAGDDGSLTANIDDLWQMPLEDAGPAGADKGQGGKYLVLPPRLRRQGSERLYRTAATDLCRLCAVPLDPQEPRAARCRQGGRLRQADQGLSPFAGRQSAAGQILRREGGGV